MNLLYTSWNEHDERRLYEYLGDKKFILTNYLSKGAVVNTILKDAIKNNCWYVASLRNGHMRAQKNDDTFEEVLVVDSEETARRAWGCETNAPDFGIR